MGAQRALDPLSRRRMGCPAARRQKAVRVPDPRGRAGRPELGHDPEEAGKLPRRFRWFDPQRVARYDRRNITTLLMNDGILRNRQKVVSAVAKARALLKVE